MNRLARSLTSPWLAAILLVLGYLMAVTGVAHKTVTFDELGHLAGGHLMWAKGDFRTVPHNGNLPQRLGGLPALWRNDQYPSPSAQGWAVSDFYEIGDQFLYQLGNNPEELLFVSRCMMALLVVATGLLVYFWSRSLFGPAGGMLSLVLATFSPTFLAHGPLITSDMAAAFFFCAAMGALWRLFHHVNGINVALSGLALAGLFLSKTSSVIIILMGLFLLAVRLCDPSPLPVQWPGLKPVRGTLSKVGVFGVVLIAQVVIVWLCIWLAYDFRYSAFCDFQFGQSLAPGGWGFALERSDLKTEIFKWLKEGQWFPEAFLFGAAVVVRLGQARQSFLNGEYSLVGFRDFFPYAFTVKETLPFLLLLVLALAALIAGVRVAGKSGRAYFWSRLYATSPLLLLVFFYGLFSLTSNLNIGHRHLLPMYPPLFILAGAAGGWWSRRPAWMGVLVALLLGWHVVESVKVRPHYLSYFNQLAGGPSQGYKHLVDSSIDWGQDLPGLKQWLLDQKLENSPATPFYLLYFGTGRPERHGIQANILSGYPDRAAVGPIEPLRPGTYAISATLFEGIYQPIFGAWTQRYEMAYQAQKAVVAELTAARNNPAAMKTLEDRYKVQGLQSLQYEFPRLRTARLCAWLRAQDRRPDANIGYSILIFRLTDDDLKAALEAPFPTSATTPQLPPANP